MGRGRLLPGWGRTGLAWAWTQASRQPPACAAAASPSGELAPHSCIAAGRESDVLGQEGEPLPTHPYLSMARPMHRALPCYVLYPFYLFNFQETLPRLPWGLFFNKWGSRGLKRLNENPAATQLVSSRAGLRHAPHRPAACHIPRCAVARCGNGWGRQAKAFSVAFPRPHQADSPERPSSLNIYSSIRSFLSILSCVLDPRETTLNKRDRALPSQSSQASRVPRKSQSDLK